MSDAAGFLRAICADPADDTPRLVYADWLDEHDDPARAEFIRVQCELAKMGPPPVHVEIDGRGFSFLRGGGGTDVPANVGLQVGQRFDLTLTKPRRGQRAEFHGLLATSVSRGRYHNYVEFKMDAESRPWPGEALRRRERELLRTNVLGWCESAFGPLGSVSWPHNTDPIDFVAVPFGDDGGHEVKCVFRRGFIEQVTCTAAAFLGAECRACRGEGRYDADNVATERVRRMTCRVCRGKNRAPGCAAAMALACPLREVWLSDKKPANAGWPQEVRKHPWYWEWEGNRPEPPETGHHWHLPGDFWGLLEGYSYSQCRVRPGHPKGGGADERFYDTEAAANTALSQACVRLARDAAGLPELTSF